MNWKSVYYKKYIGNQFTVKIHKKCGYVARVEYWPLAQETGVQSQVKSYQRLKKKKKKKKKKVLDVSLLNTQYYKVGIKGKVEKSREKSSALPFTLVL